jgi:release factor glutamine methyltransferase
VADFSGHEKYKIAMRVVELIAQGAKRLSEAGCLDVWLESLLILSHTLGKSKEWVLAHPEAQVVQEEEHLFFSLLERRAKREPLPYILGQVEFYGITLKIDRRALIPRPETELLVEKALEWARSLPSLTVADVGTGSGAVAIALALHLGEKGLVYGLDSSPQALELAQENAALNRVEKRIVFLLSDLLSALEKPVDLIVANLPYVPSAQLEKLAPELQWEPREALDGGPDGLESIRKLLSQAPSYLKRGGAILLEVGPGQARKVKALARKAFPHARISSFPDLRGIMRVVMVEDASP